MKKKTFKSIKEYIVIFLILFLPAWSINQLLVPYVVVSGELTGLCEIIYFATNTYIPIWVSSLTLNTILIAIAIYLMGWKFCIKTIYGILSINFWFKFIPITETPFIDNIFLGVGLAGFVNGLGLAIVFWNKGNSGGTDIIAMIVNKYKKISIGKVLFLCDLVIIGCSWFLPQITEVSKLFFGLFYTLISATTIDTFTYIFKQIKNIKKN